MKHLFLFLIAIFSVLYILAQNGYHVLYTTATSGTKTFSYSINGQPKTATVERTGFKYHLLFNDSLAYSYIVREGMKEPYEKADTIFNKPKHHDTYFIKSSQEYLHYSAYPNKRKPSLFPVSVTYHDFIKEEDNVVINGLNCERGYVVVAPSDTLFAIISKEIKVPYGPFAFAGLRGLVVEMYRPRYNQHILISEIKKGNYYIRIPDVPRKKR